AAQERRVFCLREVVAHWTIEDLQLGERLLDRRARLEPADHLDLQRAGPALAWWLNHRLVRRGDPRVRLNADLQPEELARRDSDDGHRRLVDRDLRADHGGIEVEALLPVWPADDRHRGRGSAEPIVVRSQQPAGRRPQAERRKVVAGDILAVGDLGVEAVAGEAESRRRGGEEFREDMVAVAEVLVVPPRDL